MSFLQKIISVLGVGAVSVFFLGGCAHVSVPLNSALEKEENIPILLYHHIADLPATASRSQRRWTLSPKKFQNQLDWIVAHGFEPITMAHLIAHLKHGQPLPAKPIVLTFDDGWKEHYSEVLPILKKHDFSATFFIISDSVGHSAYMNWEQLQAMSAAGMDIQPHSHTHRKLTALPEKDSWSEIIESKKILESRLNKPAVIFSYPYGSYNDTTITLVKEAGFEAAVSVSGLNGGYLFRKDQSYTLVRYPVEGDDSMEEIARTKGFDY